MKIYIHVIILNNIEGVDSAKTSLYSASQKNQNPETKGCCDQVPGCMTVLYLYHKVWPLCFRMIHCWNSSSHASLSSIVFKIEYQNSFVTLYGRQITYNNRIKCGPGGILNRSEPRNNMVYGSYDFYLINLVFIFIISHHSHMCPSPFFTEFSLPRHDRDGYRAFFNIAWSAQKI